VVLVLFFVWQAFVAFCDARSGGAVAHARDLIGLERDLHVPSEAWVQRHADLPVFRAALDRWYIAAHWLATPAIFVWLWCRHRDVYYRWRAVLLASTFVCFVVQLWTVAPPRVALAGIVNTGAIPSGESAIAAANVAFPSLHCAWALVVGLALLEALPRGWRWAGGAYFATTVVAVVVTGNHYWIDAAASSAVVVLCAVPRLRWEARRGLA
jgi:hypothetical protein